MRLLADGRLQRPFVYGMVKTVNMETLTRTYEIDPERRHPLALFVRGDGYRLWDLWEGEIHLFGTADGGGAYLLGTDRDGRGLLSRIILGSRLSLSIGLVGVALSFCFGIVLGSVSGYFGGAVDMVIQRFIEVLTSIPTLPLWMGLSAALPLRWPVVKPDAVVRDSRSRCTCSVSLTGPRNRANNKVCLTRRLAIPAAPLPLPPPLRHRLCRLKQLSEGALTEGWYGRFRSASS